MNRFLSCVGMLVLTGALAACGGGKQTSSVSVSASSAEPEIIHALNQEDPIPADSGSLALTENVFEEKHLSVSTAEGMQLSENEGDVLVTAADGLWKICFHPFRNNERTNLLNDIRNTYSTAGEELHPDRDEAETELQGCRTTVLANNIHPEYYDPENPFRVPAVHIITDYGSLKTGEWAGLWIELSSLDPERCGNIYDLLREDAVLAVLNHFRIIEGDTGNTVSADGITVTFPTRWDAHGGSSPGPWAAIREDGGLQGSVYVWKAVPADPAQAASMLDDEPFGRSWNGREYVCAFREVSADEEPYYKLELYSALDEKNCLSVIVSLGKASREDLLAYIETEPFEEIMNSIRVEGESISEGPEKATVEAAEESSPEEEQDTAEAGFPGKKKGSAANDDIEAAEMTSEEVPEETSSEETFPGKKKETSSEEEGNQTAELSVDGDEISAADLSLDGEMSLTAEPSGDAADTPAADTSANGENAPEFILDDSGMLTGYTGDGPQVVIPDSVNGVPVTGIGAGCFRGKELEMLVIPESVTYIGSGGAEAQVIVLCSTEAELEENAVTAMDLILPDVYTPEDVHFPVSPAFVSARNQILIAMDASMEQSDAFDDYLERQGQGRISWFGLEPGFLTWNQEDFETEDSTVVHYTGEGGTVCIPIALAVPGGDGSVRYTDPGTIRSGAFAGSAVTELIIPSLVLRIEDGAFADCRNLRDIWLTADVVWWDTVKARDMGSGAFAGVPADVTVHIPACLTEEERAASEAYLHSIGMPETAAFAYYSLQNF